ncbi:protein of unassigned function [Methylobacterium oryzae CBMB20]|uniref:Protein of unassigned function n=1 Tax=Methylobacterium oryzae CBMB20 TaxID=693986 RepID=A0A089Q088_9HYPH|nr:protein of unassigned function [Methylobacterium oryzae CBMB20]
MARGHRDYGDEACRDPRLDGKAGPEMERVTEGPYAGS